MPKYTTVKDLSVFELDNITELRALGNESEELNTIGEHLLTRVRDDFVEADEYDRWDAPSRRYEVIHELADSLVPVYTTELMRTLSVVGYAWSVELSRIGETAMLFDFGNRDYRDSSTPDAMAAQALYLALWDALTNLYEWAEENTTEEDDEDED